MDGFGIERKGLSGGHSQGSNQPGDGASSPESRFGSVTEVPSISLPKGGGAIRGIGEKFAANPVTGTGSLTVPIATSPGRSGFGPQLSLSYDSGSGNGPFGLGWSLSLPSITRKTDKGLPRYRDVEESDEFILSGAEDLVPVLIEKNGAWDREILDPRPVHGKTYHIQRYRPRIEGLFARIERWTNQDNPKDCFWRSISKDNITTWYGKTTKSRVADPIDESRIFSWLICESHDDKGNVIVYDYKTEDSKGVSISSAHEQNRTEDSRSANHYLKSIRYGNHKPYFPDLKETGPAAPLPGDKEWYFEVVFDYGEHDAMAPTPGDSGDWSCRNDPFSSYRAGFEVRSYRLCQRVLMFHHFKDEPGVRENCLVRSTDFAYRYEDDPTDPRNPIHSVPTSVTQSGYKRRYGGYLKRSLPPLDFAYSQATIDETVREIDAESLENLPYGLDGSTYQWVDLDGEGVSGVLTEQAGAWFYKRNLSPASFEKDSGHESPTVMLGPLECVAKKPSFSRLGAGGPQFLDLAGDGQLDLVELDGPTPGFFERTHDEDWAPFRAFESLPNLNWGDPNLKFVDLTGDGHADILITEDAAFCWHPSLAEAGFAPSEQVRKALDEEKGPRLVFADGTQSIYLTDMSGDGLTDLARIRNGEVCYWPNLGYGHFGAKVTMDSAPWFDSPDQFDQKRIRLADIDGSGVTDIIYLKSDGPHIYLNHSGNSWSQGRKLDHFLAIDNLSSVLAMDLLGNGTACLVWSSPLPGHARQPMKYIDLMGGQKPHLLIRSINNLGAETVVHYAPSTKFYVGDKFAGKPWITKIPFPVHVVERVETYDHISRNRFVTRYAYHHGYFDGVEREFRGFGMVEQWDTEEFRALNAGEEFPPGTNVDERHHVPPVHTKTWFHTGIYLGRGQVSNFFAGMLDGKDIGEYFREPAIREDDTEARKFLLEDTVLEDEWSIEEAREACRALKGSMLRQEVYALDAPSTDEYPSGLPYTVIEQNFTIRRVQAKGQNAHGVFFAHPREAINCHYERNPDDPRISHTLTLSVDDYGNVLRSVAIGYRRRPGAGARHAEQEHTHITFTANRVANYSREQDWYRVGLPIETRTFEIVNPWEPERSGPRVIPFQFNRIHDEMESLWPEAQQDPLGERLWPYENWDWRRQADQQPLDTRLRLIEHVRTLFRPDDMGTSQGNQLTLLPLGVVESRALPGETYKLAYTSDLLDQVYERDGQNLLPANVTGLLSGGGGESGGYIDWDGGWWIPSGRVFHTPYPSHTPDDELSEALQHFFVPRRYRDPFHKLNDNWDTETFVDYDAYDLLVKETRDALDNRVTVGERRFVLPDGTVIPEKPGNDYRVLQPRLMMDPNRNRSEVAFDALGLVVGTAVMGKPEDEPAKGDVMDESFIADIPTETVDEFYDAADPHDDAEQLLNKATTRILYDLDLFRLSRELYPDQPEKWEPVFAATLARETHINDPPTSGQLKIQISFSYSDGFGREIQKKIQAENGQVPKRDAAGKIIVGPDGRPEMIDNDKPVRWVGSGWTIFNNKGKPVRQFEPFFTDTHKPDFDIKIGVSPALFYDPVERVIATLHPNYTYEKVVFDPWQQATYDVNDTVDLKPQSDPDIKDYVEKYCASLPIGWKTWLQQRNVDPDNPPPDTNGVEPERDAAVRTLKHANTPTLAHFDSLGRTFFTVADNGKDSDGNPQKYRTRVVLDIEGNQREVIDAKDHVVMHYDYDLLGNRIHQASMEAGKRWMLNDVTSKPILAWDSRGHNFVTKYDQLRRPIEQWVRGTDALQPDERTSNKDILFAKTEYGEGGANLALNLRTRVFKQYDGAGVVTNEAYDFKGNLRGSTRQVYPDYKNIINWDTTQPAGESFSSSTTYDALNRPTSLVAPDNSEVRPSYNEANLLNALEANLRGDPVATKFVTNIDYNANGQRLRIDYENGATTHYRYDEETYRLIRLRTVRGNKSATDCVPILEPRTCEDPPAICQRLATDACIVQDLSYTYDPAGNITHIRDDAQQTVYFKNRIVEPSNDYKYDAIYRLIQATGREHLGQAGESIPHSYNDAKRVNLLHPGDGNAMGRYCEEYVYDAVGNILEMIHRRSCPEAPSWKRAYTYNEASLLALGNESNRLTSTKVAGIDEIYSSLDDGYDAHGNMLRMPQLQVMQWDFQDRLQVTQRQKVATDPDDEEGQKHHGEKTYYVYDASGQRVRKVTERYAPAGQAPTRMKERIYVGGFEIYREYNGDGNTVTLERKTLHIMDDKQRIALVETRTQGDDGSPEQLIRYQFGNHLGSACLELDHQARVVSYEEYTPYGSTSYQAVDKAIKAAAKRYRYTGKERDEESGLYYQLARYYVPWLGRWCACDPLWTAKNSDLYVYVRNRPIDLVDPEGLEEQKEQKEQYVMQAGLTLAGDIILVPEPALGLGVGGGVSFGLYVEEGEGASLLNLPIVGEIVLYNTPDLGLYLNIQGGANAGTPGASLMVDLSQTDDITAEELFEGVSETVGLSGGFAVGAGYQVSEPVTFDTETTVPKTHTFSAGLTTPGIEGHFHWSKNLWSMSLVDKYEPEVTFLWDEYESLVNEWEPGPATPYLDIPRSLSDSELKDMASDLYREMRHEVQKRRNPKPRNDWEQVRSQRKERRAKEKEMGAGIDHAMHQLQRAKSRKTTVVNLNL